MIELITTLITAGGSAGFGSLLKVFGGLFDSLNKTRELKAEIELARRAKEMGYEIELQKMHNDPYSRTTRRLLALIGMSTLSILTLWCAFVPEIPLVTLAREAGEGSLLFGLITYPVSGQTLTVTLGHIALVSGTVVLPMIVGFYFTPGGRK